MSSSFSSLDFYRLAVSTNVFRYGYTVILIIGFIGNICQIMTFSRKTMRQISTGVLFLVLSLSDTIYLLIAVYVVHIYGFQQSDRSNMSLSCRIRHFTSYFISNFSAWILTMISCDRWIRSQFPVKAQRICTPRSALLVVLVLASIDILLHFHLLTPMFGVLTVGPGGTCGANAFYPSYVYFHTKVLPTINIISAVLLPAVAMIIFLSATIVNIQNRRHRISPSQTTGGKPQENSRKRFIHRQMFILMFVTLTLFFVTCLPVALYRFTVATLDLQQPFTLVLLLTAIVGVIQASSYALNFYLHCLTSKLFRREFLQIFRSN